jgi:L,D-transpeptidase-like protein
VYAAPSEGRSHRLRERTFDGQRISLVFSVLSHRPGWVHVQLPTRPNHASGWLRRHDVRFSYTQLRVRVDLHRHQLLVTRNHRAVLRASIGVGRAVSPTPHGRYYLTDVVRPPDRNGFYGPYALGLSAHSPVYTTFEGGDGQVGIHGTNAPAAIGHDVSHGCIRVRNAVIRRLAHLLPLGVPVSIER